MQSYRYTSIRLFGGILEVAVVVVSECVFSEILSDSENVRNEVVAVLLLLETTERHLGARNVLLGVLEVLEL